MSGGGPLFCTQCGARHDTAATTCSQCGFTLRRPSFGDDDAPQIVSRKETPSHGVEACVSTPRAGNIPNHLAPSILVTIFCCLPLGIVAILYAGQVNLKIAAGDLTGARESSSNAKLWAWMAFATGAASVLLGIVYVFSVLSQVAHGLGH